MNGSIFPCRPINGNSIFRFTASDISQQTSVCQLNIIALDKENPRIAGYPFNDSSTSYPKFRIVNLDTDNKNPSMNPPTPHHVPLRHRFLFIYIFTSNTILNFGGFFFSFSYGVTPGPFPLDRGPRVFKWQKSNYSRDSLKIFNRYSAAQPRGLGASNDARAMLKIFNFIYLSNHIT